MTFAAPVLAGIITLLALTGCQTFHADLSNEQITRKVHDRFHVDMTSNQVREKLRIADLDELQTWSEDDLQQTVHAGDIGAIIWPKRMFYNGVNSAFNRDMLLFRFGGDDALDDVVWRPFGWVPSAGDPLIIHLNDSEATP